MDTLFTLIGGITACTHNSTDVVRNKVICSLNSSEYNSSNSWNLNFSDGNVNNNNNKNNSNVGRPVSAIDVNNLISWIKAYKDCCKHKKSSKDCVGYRIIAQYDLPRLVEDIYTHTYKPGVNKCFIVTRPKPREIFAANFRDRIVQHWIMLSIRPLFENRFNFQGNVTFNCRAGYGSLLAIQILKKRMEEVSDNYTTQTFIGKFDLKSFFMTIDKNKLLELLIPFVTKGYQGNDLDTLIYLIKKTVLNCPQNNCIRKSPAKMWNLLPSYKSLFNLPSRLALAIGNITSQEMANFFMSYFDEWALSKCDIVGARYIRFVDDFVIVCRDKRFIIKFHKEATKWLKDNLLLTLHQAKFYLQEVTKGIKFIGGVIKPGRVYTANSTVGGLHNRLYDLEHLCDKIVNHRYTFRDLKQLENMINSVNSYMGFLVHSNSYALKRKLFGDLKCFWKCCFIYRKYSVVCIRKKYKYKLRLFKQIKKHELELCKYRGRIAC